MIVFTEIYKQHYKAVYRLAYKILNNKENAADISQEVFLSLYNQLNQKREIRNISSWLYKVTSNQCMSFFNKNKTINEQLNDKELSTETQTGRNPEISKALKKMKVQDKILLTLYSEDFSYKEIAEITGIKFTSIGKTLSRALNKLKNEIELQK